MDKVTEATVKALSELTVNGKQATLRKARKAHKCTECGLLIEPRTPYYEIILIGGSGVGGFLHPAHVHQECINSHLNIGGR